jgi:hypothetical protein
MSGTSAGALKANATIIAKYGEDFFKKIGAKGGKHPSTGGFKAKIPCACAVIEGGHIVVQCAGKKGGLISRRTKA